MHFKIHKSYRNVVSLCDKEIIGKKFEEGKKQLEVRKNFFSGEVINLEKARKLLQKEELEDATFNIVGENSVQIALDAGIINKENIGRVQNIPFALTLL